MAGKKTIALLAALAMLLAAGAASAAEISSAEYKERVEPICQANKAKEEILRHVHSEVKKGELKKASRQISIAAAALKKTYAKLSRVPKPAEDAARLTKWLKGIRTEAALLKTTGRKLAKGEQNAAQKMIVRLQSNAIKTLNQVRDYEFRYCQVNPSKFI